MHHEVGLLLLITFIIGSYSASIDHHAANSVVQKGTRITVWRRDMERDKHHRIKMGVPNPDCDDAKTNLTIDWDEHDTSTYECDPSTTTTSSSGSNLDFHCYEPSTIEMPEHECMNTELEYATTPPTNGSHRPLWPRYGEYVYCPPQRWTHSLEHRAVVMLYDPCADGQQVQTLKNLVKSCLRRYVITPYKGMEKPLALVTYGCRLLMNQVDEEAAQNFIIQHSTNGPEEVSDDGQYDTGFISGTEPSTVPGSNDVDSCRCPQKNACTDAA